MVENGEILKLSYKTIGEFPHSPPLFLIPEEI